MKLRNVALIIWSLSAFIFIQCDSDDDDLSPVEVARAQLIGTWEVDQVLLNGFDVTNPSYTDFVILFRPDGSYFALDANPVFTESGGFWQFINNDPERLEIGAEEVIESTVTFSEDSNVLTLSFTAVGEEIGASGRTKGLEGEYEFRLLRSDQQIE
ncbi:MAG: hypothetical protein AAF519_10955 [Bacteroidota bacterium]